MKSIKKQPLKKLEGGARARGVLPEGCVRCAHGATMVLLVTGICEKNCFYCPLSREKKGKDVVYANERSIEKNDDFSILEEARLIDAEATGITGGDPMAVLERTLHCVALLKKEFGEAHHIHLYTASQPSRDALTRLKEAGLDEIRFHVPPAVWKNVEKSAYVVTLKNSSALGFATGVEIPSLPGDVDSILALARSLDAIGVHFLNLNELEFSETNSEALLDRGYELVDDVSSAVKGSEDTAVKILEAFDGAMTVHYCPSRYKDAVQLRKRLMRRARNCAKPYEVITDDSTLIKGIIASNDKALLDEIKEKFDIPGELIEFNAVKKRIEIAPWILERISADIGAPCFIIEEYPTADHLEVERTPL